MTWQITGSGVIDLSAENYDKTRAVMDKITELPRRKGIADILVCVGDADSTVLINHQNYGAKILEYHEFYDYINLNHPEELL